MALAPVLIQTLQSLSAAVALYVFLYPLLMSFVWMFGACLFFFRHERRRAPRLPTPSAWPMVSVLLPCFNEADNVDEVVRHTMALDYPHYEVIAINDGSTDATARRLDALAQQHPRLRVIHLASNQGKAVALNTAMRVAAGTILVGIDGDAVLDPGALRRLVLPLDADPGLGAVTGNPRIRTRSTVLGRMQVAEFSSTIGLIKRAQQALSGRLYTVSGVIAAFRREALEAIGGWCAEMLTEDIDVSWRLQLAGWRIRFEPSALVWILMPETLAGLWRQRLRWAMGGLQVACRLGPAILRRPGARRLWPVLAEYLASLLWAWLMGLTLLALLSNLLYRTLAAGDGIPAALLLPGWTGLLIALTCLCQFLLGLCMDARYDVGLRRVLGTMIWYPVIYWSIGMASAIWALPCCLKRGRGRRALWVSPDRGLRPDMAIRSSMTRS